jgi:hypothetical protein
MNRAWLVLLATGALAAPAAARAETQVGIGIAVASPPRGYYYRDAYSLGFDRGARDGAEEGRGDGRHHRDFDFWREGDYRKGTDGYKGWMGPKWEYANGYRRGYESAYRRAYAAASRGWGYPGPYYGDRNRGDRYYGDERYGYPDDRYRYDDRYRRDDRYRYDDRYRDENR